jgi:hypothetical protein
MPDSGRDGQRSSGLVRALVKQFCLVTVSGNVVTGQSWMVGIISKQDGWKSGAGHIQQKLAPGS